MGPTVTGLYLVHGAVCTAMNLLAVQSVSTYVGYSLGMGVILCISPRAALATYGLGLAALIGAELAIVPSAAMLVSTLPTCVTITAVGLALAAVFYTARRREFDQRLTIEHQRDQLGTLNAELERRVQVQVGEIQAQVRARSSELSLALARLARRRPDDAMLRGTVLGGRFVVGDVIGEGGMGAVYDGVDRATGDQVAIKVVQATSSRTLDALRRFADEASAAAAIVHPAVVRMIDIGISDEGLLFQAQELIRGESLARRLSRAWRPGDAARLGAVLCDALAAVHAVGVVHRDVKPENAMLTAAAPGLKLLDFGIAKLHAAVQGHGRGDGTDTMTRTGMVVGTPAYMAPEQALGTAVTDRADVYAVGAILFRLLTERPPFEAESARALVAVRALHDPPRVRAFQPTVPASLAELVDGCLVRPAADRPSAAELAPRLAAWADAAGAPALEFAARRACDAIATASSNHRAVPMC
jgi:serine/threonine-protein kinase